MSKKRNNFFIGKTKPDLSKYHMFWLSYECFAILCDASLLKRVISSHNSCGNKTICKTILETILLLIFKIVEIFKCILTCKKLDIFNIKNQILLRSGFIFDLGIIAT